MRVTKPLKNRNRLARSLSSGAFLASLLAVFGAFAAAPDAPKDMIQGAVSSTPAVTNAVPPPAPLPPHSLAAVLTNPASPTAANSADSLDDKHKLGIGDRLSFRIVEDQEEVRPLVVTDSGEIEVPYIGRVRAQDKSCRHLAAEIKAELEKEYYYQATVILAVDQMTRARGRVYVIGDVRMAGPMEMPGDETLTVSKAIIRAGGFTDFADKKRVRINRGSTNAAPIEVDVDAILNKGQTDKDVPLQPNDFVYVPGRLFRF
jgi:protein involved in polysaccharide export with SLBB domain